MKSKPKDNDKEDLRPDGWQRFEKAVDAAIKSGPKHKTATPKSKERPASKGRVHKGKTGN
jgi:hypothetical protein